jgi:hypothetical protein
MIIDTVYGLLRRGKFVPLELVQELSDYFTRKYDLQKLDVPNHESIKLIRYRFPFSDFGHTEQDIKFMKDLQSVMADYNVPMDALDEWGWVADRRYNFERNNFFH